MKRTGTLAAILLIAAASFAQAPDSITFAHRTVAAGDTWTESSAYATDITFNLNDSFRELAPVKRSTSIEREKSVTVIATTAADRIAAVDVSYELVKRNGVDVSSTFAGKTYRVMLKGNKVESVTYADGSVPPEDETTFVLWDNNRHEQARAMNRAFGGRTIAIGELVRVHDPADLVDTDSGMIVTDFTMTLVEIDPGAEAATFEIRMKLANKVRKPRKSAADEPEPFDTSSVTLDLTGSLRATAAGRITRMAFSGPVLVSGSKEKSDGVKGPSRDPRAMRVAGEGTAMLTSSYRY